MGSLTLLERFPVELWIFLRPDQRVSFGQGTGCTFRKEKNHPFDCYVTLPFSTKKWQSGEPWRIWDTNGFVCMGVKVFDRKLWEICLEQSSKCSIM